MDLKINQGTQAVIDNVALQQRFLNLQLQVSLLSDLVDKLDPENNYSFDADKGEFVKTAKENSDESEVLNN